MATGANKPAMLRLGYFAEPGYITIGEQYRDVKTVFDDRYRGRQIQTASSKHGKTGRGVYFSKAPRLFDGDFYQTWEEIQRKYRNEKSRGAIGAAPFRPSAPSKRHSGSGDYYGTLSGKAKNMDTGQEHKLKREDVTHKPPNIVTAPSKRGSYGTWGTFLGYRKGFKGTAGEYQYLPDPFDANHEKAVERAKARRNQEEERPPFRPGNPTRKWPSGYKLEYVPEGAPRQLGTKKKANEDEPERPPFRPSNPGYAPNKFPEHIPDPYDSNERARKAALKADAERKAKLGDRPAFNAMSWQKSTRTPSVFRMNIKC